MKSKTLHGARWGALLSTLLFPLSAHAHFLWGEVGEENPPLAKISFAEGSGEISTDVPVERIEVARAWTPDKKPLALQTGGGVRRAPLQNARVFGAAQTWGVLDKTAEGRGVFKLEYHAKAAATLADASTLASLPLELFATRDGVKGVLVSLKRGDKPVSKTVLYLHEPNEEKPRTLTTDDKGEAHFESKTPGLYGLRASWGDDKAGELNGKKYALTRHYTTLSFRVAASTPATREGIPQSGAASMAQGAKEIVPGPHPKADKAAYDLLKSAHDNRQVMPENFAGFSAKVMYKKDGVAHNGTLVYRRKGKTEIEFPGLTKEDFSWLEDKVLNLIGHRRGGDFNRGDGRHALSLGKLPVNNFGTLVELNDGMKSNYRVKDNKVTEVTREMGDTRFTIAVIETMEADAGKYLANHFIVTYRSAKTGDLTMLEGYRDNYAKVDGVWLPVMRFVFTSKAIAPGEADTPTMQIIKFSDIKLLEAVQVAAVK